MSEQVEVSQPKFEWTNEQKTIDGILYTRIRAVKDFADVKVGDLGGWMDKATFLSDTGNCWVYDNAIASGSFLYDDATITDEAFVRRSTLRIFSMAVGTRSYVASLVCTVFENFLTFV